MDIKPLSPQDLIEERKVNDNVLIEKINDLLRKNTGRNGVRRIYSSTLKSKANDIRDEDIDRVMAFYESKGWNIQKQNGVEVDRGVYETVYDFKANYLSGTGVAS